MLLGSVEGAQHGRLLLTGICRKGSYQENRSRTSPRRGMRASSCSSLVPKGSLMQCPHFAALPRTARLFTWPRRLSSESDDVEQRTSLLRSGTKRSKIEEIVRLQQD